MIDVVTFELGRSDIGFGRVIVDDEGITRERLFTRRRIAWADVRSYTIGALPTGRADGFYDISTVFDWVDILRGKVDPDRLRYRFELIGDRDHLRVNWRFEHVELAIDAALRRIGPRLLAGARRELQVMRVARFGPLAISADGVAWKAKPPLPREAVEAIEIADRLPLEFRIVRRERVLAYASPKLSAVPNALQALELAEELGYRVRGRELLRLR